MAFEFKKKESVDKAIKRLARNRIKKALCDLERCQRLEAVHEVRKQIKQLRALLRLVRGALSRSVYRQCTCTLREAAGHLATARDAHVKVTALADLTTHFKAELSSRSFDEIKGILSAHCRKQRADLSRTHAPNKVGRLLSQFSKRLNNFELERSGWAAIGPGIKRSYRDGRRGYRLAHQTGMAVHFHE